MSSEAHSSHPFQDYSLNSSADDLAHMLAEDFAAEFRCHVESVPDGGRTIDLGVKAPGGLEAGLWLADVCLSGLGEVKLRTTELFGGSWPSVQVHTDHPVAACLLSQYAGWQLSVGKYFAMGSGPMRAAAAVEPLFEHLHYRETADRVVGVLEGRKLPSAEVYQYIAEKCGVAADHVTLLIAPTASLAGTMQVAARSVETAMHKMHEVGFDVRRVEAGFGTAPLPPVAKDDFEGIGRTNDAILYGGRVTLWVRGDDDSIAEVGPRLPASASPAYGEPFKKIFAAAGNDFYKIDPLLFSPGEILINNLDTGRMHRFGRLDSEVLSRSFGL